MADILIRDGQSSLMENTPLLIDTENEQRASSPPRDDAHGNDDINEQPLPVFQIVLLCYARMVEPLSFFCIFPFISQMIERTGVSEADIGFYSGLIESLFSVTQTILMLAWGKAADSLGRKPVLVFSLAGMSVCISAFGFCDKSLVAMVVLRSLAGVFGGTLVYTQTFDRRGTNLLS